MPLYLFCHSRPSAEFILSLPKDSGQAPAGIQALAPGFRVSQYSPAMTGRRERSIRMGNFVSEQQRDSSLSGTPVILRYAPFLFPSGEAKGNMTLKVVPWPYALV
jgi:hypothetical protein